MIRQGPGGPATALATRTDPHPSGWQERPRRCPGDRPSDPARVRPAICPVGGWEPRDPAPRRAREDVVLALTRVRNRLHADLRVLVPGYGARASNLTTIQHQRYVSRTTYARLVYVQAELALDTSQPAPCPRERRAGAGRSDRCAGRGSSTAHPAGCRRDHHGDTRRRGGDAEETDASSGIDCSGSR